MNIRELQSKFHNDPLGLLNSLGGYYFRPPGGPLVGYAGTYEDGGEKRNFVGELYANFAVAEEWPSVIDMWARQICFVHSEPLRDINVFLGAPEGGKSLADKLALSNSLEYIFPDVKETSSLVGRPKKELVWGRHKLGQGKTVAIVEDVANNFSTTNKLIKLVVDAGSRPALLVCLLNRSENVEDTFESELAGPIPVISLVRKPMPEYRQDHPHVVTDVTSGNIVWKPRATPADWQRLVDAMAGKK